VKLQIFMRRVLLQASILLLKLSLHIIIQDFYQRTSAFQVKSPEIKAVGYVLGPIKYTCSRASWIPKKKKIFLRYYTQRPWQDFSWITGLTVFKAPFLPEICYSPYGPCERKLKAFPGCEVYLVLITNSIL
jgi:hypothetical protein